MAHQLPAPMESGPIPGYGKLVTGNQNGGFTDNNPDALPTTAMMIRKTLKILLAVILLFILATVLFMQQASFGKMPSGSRLERIKKSAQFMDGNFQNLVETKMLSDDASYWRMIKRQFANDPRRAPITALPSVKTDLKNLPADKPSLVWFGHSSYLISIGGKKILADPVFSERTSPVQYFGPKSYPGTMVYNIDEFPDLDIVIISHDHYDHLDFQTIQQLKNKTSLFCVPLGIGEHLEHWGIAPENIKEFDWWEGEMVMEGVQLTSTPARHFSGRGFSRNKTLWSSFVLKTGGYSIFIGGDSGYDGAFKAIGEKFGPFHLAMLECGQYDLQWPSIHMMPEETVQASLDLGAKVFLPVHWAKWTLALHPWKEPIQRAVKHAQTLNVKVTTPQIGEPIFLGEEMPLRPWWDD